MSNSFIYTYDRLNRLTSGVTADSAYAERNITYDQAGNIQTLSRVYGGDLIDSLIYHYTKNGLPTNQVQTIQDLSTDLGTTGYAAGTGTYHYDPNGNMNVFSSTNAAAKTYSTTYNLLNLPNLVHSTVSSVYEYDASGEKLSRLVDTNETDYVSGIQYDNNRISFIQTEEGRAFPYSTDTSNYYQYF